MNLIIQEDQCSITFWSILLTLRPDVLILIDTSCSECFLFPLWSCAACMDFHRAHSSMFQRKENQRKSEQSDPAAAGAVAVWERAWITQRSFLNTALRFPVCETKDSVVTFVSRWYGTKPLTSGDVSAAAKSYLWLLIADQGLITLINGSGIWGPDLWGLLSVSVKLKRSRRRTEERARPVGAIRELTADTSQMEPVASIQGGMFGERYLLLTISKPHRKHLRLEREKGFFMLFILNIFSTFLSHTHKSVSWITLP